MRKLKIIERTNHKEQLFASKVLLFTPGFSPVENTHVIEKPF